jgi:hypothetical protein
LHKDLYRKTMKSDLPFSNHDLAFMMPRALINGVADMSLLGAKTGLMALGLLDYPDLPAISDSFSGSRRVWLADGGHWIQQWHDLHK